MQNTLDIYRQGVKIATVDIDENTVFSSKLPGTEIITCPIDSLQVLSLQEEDYIIHKGVVYKIRTLPDFGKSSETLAKSYKIDFLARFYDLHDTYVQDEGAHVFPYFGSAADHLQLLVDSANLTDTGWVLGTVEATDDLLLNYDWTFARPALDMIAEAFKLEWNAVGTTINMVATIGNDTGLTFEMGRGKGLHGITRSSDTSKEKINRVYGIGGSRNIDSTYRNGEETNLVFQERYVETAGVTAGTERVREGKYENPEIYPRFEGVVSNPQFTVVDGKITSVTINDSNINFDLMQHLQEGVKPKVSFLTGPVTGVDFEISGYNNTTKTITLIPFTDTTGYYYPSDTSKPEAGDKFTFIDVRMPAAYVATWEAKLKTETLAFLNQNKSQRLIFGVTPDEKHLRDNNIFLKVGDRATAIDTDMGVNEVLRFTELSYPIVNEFKITGVIGNDIVYNPVAKLFADVLSVTKQVQVISRTNDIQAKRNTQNIRSLASSIFDTDGMFDSAKLNVGVLTTMLAIIGTKSQNFRLNKVYITDNLNGNPNSVSITGGELIHREISNPGNNNIWILNPITETGLNPTSLYYVYCRCSKTSQVGTFVITTDQVKPEDVNGFWMFLTGVIYPVNNGYRDSDFTNGIADINPARLKIGKIVSPDSSMEINLESGTIKGDITFVGNSLSAINSISNNATSALSNAAAAQGVANTAISNASSALTAAGNAQSSANAANQLIANIANDNILTSSEKPDVLKEYNIIVGERPIIVAQAGQYSVNATIYDNNYTALINYLIPLLAAMGSDDAINGPTFRQYFTNYYNEKVSLLSAIAVKAKQLADAAQATANTAISNAAAVQNNLTNIQNALGGLAYQSAVELAQLGSTIISGGYIKANLLDVNAIVVTAGLATQTYATNQASGYALNALQNAQSYAITQASLAQDAAAIDATTKALAAQNTATANAATLAQNAQNAATNYTTTQVAITLTAAQSYADSVAISRANVAQANAISSASADATAKANAARANAVSDSQLLINSIQLGAVNLLPNSKQTFTNANYNLVNFTAVEELIAGQQYTMTFKTVCAVKDFGLWLYNGTYFCGLFTYLENDLFTLTFNAPVSTNNVNIYNRINAGGQNHNATYYYAKLERGSKYTDWSPAVADVEQSIANAQTAANNAVNAYNNLTTQLKSMAYQDVVEYSKLGSTIIQGGYIRSNLIDADYIKSNIVNAGYIQALDLVAKSIRTPGSDKYAEISSILNNFRIYSGGKVLLEADDDSAVESITFQANDFPLPPTITITLGPGYIVGDFATADGAASMGRKGFITNGFFKKINQSTGVVEFEVSPDGKLNANSGLSVTGSISIKDGGNEFTGWSGYVFQIASGSSSQVRINQSPSVPPGATWVKTTYKNGIVVNIEGGQN